MVQRGVLIFAQLNYFLNEGEIIKHIWAGCGLGNTLYDSMLGYTIDKY